MISATALTGTYGVKDANDETPQRSALRRLFAPVRSEPTMTPPNDSADDRQTPREHNLSTAEILERAKLYGAAPGPDELDTRPVWFDVQESAEIMDHDGPVDIETAFHDITAGLHLILRGATPEGFQMGDEREAFMWGLVNVCHAQLWRLDKLIAHLQDEVRDLDSAQTGGEIESYQLEKATHAARDASTKRDAFESIRDHMAEAYKVETGEQWRPRTGSHTSRNQALTAASIEGRDYLKAQKERQTTAHYPQGTPIAITGSREGQDHNVIWATLDKARAKYPDMFIIHGGAPGAQQIAAKWAGAREVHQVVFKPDFKRHGKAAAVIRRDEEILKTLPAGVICFTGTGSPPYMRDQARQAGIKVMEVGGNAQRHELQKSQSTTTETPGQTRCHHAAPDTAVAASSSAGPTAWRAHPTDAFRTWQEQCKTLALESQRQGTHPLYVEGYDELHTQAKELAKRPDMPSEIVSKLSKHVELAEIQQAGHKIVADTVTAIATNNAQRDTLRAEARATQVRIKDLPTYPDWRTENERLAKTAAACLASVPRFSHHLDGMPASRTCMEDAVKNSARLRAYDDKTYEARNTREPIQNQHTAETNQKNDRRISTNEKTQGMRVGI